jgi:hypothetical protein
MRPLREQLEDSDLTVRAGAALLAKVSPFELSPIQRRRIRARIDAASAEPRGMRWLRPAFALPVLLVVGVAGASIGHNWYRQANTQRLIEEQQKSAPAKAPSAPRAMTPAPAPAPQAADGEELPSIVDPEDLRLDNPARAQAPRTGNQSGPGAALLMEALQARRAGDTVRAQQLTAEYNKKYPNGALREEALAISFESAAAHNDASAKRLAQKYLTTFPHGRFRKQAEQVIARQ